MVSDHDETSALTRNTVANAVIGKVLQARDIFGDVHMGEAPYRLATPRQLPMRTAHFVGRTSHLDQLSLWATGDPSSRAPVSLIVGPPGVGKTALALESAHQVAEAYPDGHLYLDLYGYAPDVEPIPPEVALPRALSALGVPARYLPADVQSQSAMLRTVLHDRRTLMIIDNAVSASQVRPLLPGGVLSWTIVTSRDSLEGLAAGGANVLRLNPLDETASTEMLRRTAGDNWLDEDKEAVARIVSYCSGLPIALAIIAAKARIDPIHSATAIWNALRCDHGSGEIMDTGDPNTSLDSVFEWSFRSLTVPAQDAFRAFGVLHVPTLSVTAASIVVAATAADTRRALLDLRRANLVEQVTPDRFRCHDLMRDYATRLAARSWSRNDRQQRFDRYLRYVVITSYAAERVIYPQRDNMPSDLRTGLDLDTPEIDINEAKTWFEEEHESLIATVRQAIDEQRFSYAWQLTWAMTTFLDRRGHWADYERTQRLGLQAAEEIDRPDALSSSHRLLATALARLGRQREAREHLDQSLRFTQAQGDTEGEARTWLALAFSHSAQGAMLDALGATERAHSLYHAVENAIGEARSLSFIAWFRAQVETPSLQALQDIDEATAKLRQLGHERELAHALHHRGFILVGFGRLDEAARAFEEAEAAFSDLTDAFFQARSLVALGDVRRDQNHPDAAHDAWTRAHNLFLPYGEPHIEQTRARLAHED